MKIVIVGNGIAGNEVAFSLREHDANHEIAILSGESFPEYDPCSLPYYIGGDVSRESVFVRKLEDYAKANIRLFLDSRIVSIDYGKRCIITEKNERIPFDKLVLAYGGCLLVPPLKGFDITGVFGCRKLTDADNLIDHRGHSAVVIGSGIVGIELAEALKKRGYDVTLIELLDWILPKMFDRPAAEMLQTRLQSYGIQVLVGERVLQIEGEKRVTGVITDRQKIPCDTVVLATGVEVETQLPQTANIEVNHGICVNEYMETNVKDIYACGDCVEARAWGENKKQSYRLKHNAIDQARVVVKNILGEEVAYEGAYSFARIHFFDTYAATFGLPHHSLINMNDLNIIERNEDESHLRIMLKQDRIIGTQAIGDFAHHIGLFMGAAWRGDNINELKRDWHRVCQIDSPYPWNHRRLGELMGFKLPESLS